MEKFLNAKMGMLDMGMMEGPEGSGSNLMSFTANDYAQRFEDGEILAHGMGDGKQPCLTSARNAWRNRPLTCARDVKVQGGSIYQHSRLPVCTLHA